VHYPSAGKDLSREFGNLCALSLKKKKCNYPSDSCVLWILSPQIFVHYGGWLRSVGWIKFQVSLAEYRLFYRALLQKRPIILIDPTSRSHPISLCRWGSLKSQLPARLSKISEKSIVESQWKVFLVLVYRCTIKCVYRQSNMGWLRLVGSLKS